MDTADIVLRLGVATLAGVVLGLNRDLRGKPTGVRTLGLVGVNQRIHQALGVTRVEKFFQYFNTVDEAERAA